MLQSLRYVANYPSKITAYTSGENELFGKVQHLFPVLKIEGVGDVYFQGDQMYYFRASKMQGDTIMNKIR